MSTPWRPSFSAASSSAYTHGPCGYLSPRPCPLSEQPRRIRRLRQRNGGSLDHRIGASRLGTSKFFWEHARAQCTLEPCDFLERFGVGDRRLDRQNLIAGRSEVRLGRAHRTVRTARGGARVQGRTCCGVGPAFSTSFVPSPGVNVLAFFAAGPSSGNTLLASSRSFCFTCTATVRVGHRQPPSSGATESMQTSTRRMGRLSGLAGEHGRIDGFRLYRLRALLVSLTDRAPWEGEGIGNPTRHGASWPRCRTFRKSRCLSAGHFRMTYSR